jgi:hypothetical protein
MIYMYIYSCRQRTTWVCAVFSGHHGGLAVGLLLTASSPSCRQSAALPAVCKHERPVATVVLTLATARRSGLHDVTRPNTVQDVSR